MKEMKTRLDESEKRNLRLKEQLEKVSRVNLEERTGLSQLNEQQKQEIILLRGELKKVNNACDALRSAAKKADAEISSYKKEHDIEFNTLKNALEDSRKINEDLQKRLKESKLHKESQQPVSDKTDSVFDVNQLQEKLAERERVIDSLNRKLQQNEESKVKEISFSSPEDNDVSSRRRSPKISQILELQKDLKEKQKLIEDLTDELNGKGKDIQESLGVVEDSNGNNRLSGSPTIGKVSRLEKELAESQMIIGDLRGKLEIRKDHKQGQTSFDKGRDVIDGSSPDGRRSSQFQKELQDVYKKNEELRKAVSENISLVDSNSQLKKELASSEQKSSALEKDLQNYTVRIKEMNSEVTRLADELARTRTLNSDYVSQLKALRQQQEQATKFYEEAVSVRSMNEKLHAEVKKLFASLENAAKENNR